MTAAPRRTCLGCRQVDDKAHLIRLVWSPADGRVVVDENQTASGRGAYVHGRCALRGMRSLPRALKRHVDGAQVAALADMIAER